MTSSQGHFTVVIKNYEPFVFGASALAILTVNGRSCFKVGWNSSSNYFQFNFIKKLII